jgi:hypothetical protein
MVALMMLLLLFSGSKILQLKTSIAATSSMIKNITSEHFVTLDTNMYNFLLALGGQSNNLIKLVLKRSCILMISQLCAM